MTEGTKDGKTLWEESLLTRFTASSPAVVVMKHKHVCLPLIIIPKRPINLPAIFRVFGVCGDVIIDFLTCVFSRCAFPTLEKDQSKPDDASKKQVAKTARDKGKCSSRMTFTST